MYQNAIYLYLIEIDNDSKSLILFVKELKIYLIGLNEYLLNKNISYNFYNDIKGFFCLYDANKIKEQKIIEELKEKIVNVAQILLVGNKTDLQNLIVVNLEDFKNREKKYKFKNIEFI